VLRTMAAQLVTHDRFGIFIAKRLTKRVLTVSSHCDCGTRLALADSDVTLVDNKTSDNTTGGSSQMTATVDHLFFSLKSPSMIQSRLLMLPFIEKKKMTNKTATCTQLQALSNVCSLPPRRL
jgi:hypothetical protein